MGVTVIFFLLPAAALAGAMISGCSDTDSSTESSDSEPRVSTLKDYAAPAPESFQQRLPAKAYSLNNYIVHDQNRDEYLDPEDMVFFKSPNGGYQPIQQGSADFQEYLKTLGHRDNNRFWLEGARQYLNIHDRKRRDPDNSGIDFRDSVLETLDQDMQGYTDADDFALINGLDFDGEAYLNLIKTDLDREFGWRLLQLSRSLEYFLSSGESKGYFYNLNESRKLADAINQHFLEDKSASIDAIEARAASMGIK